LSGQMDTYASLHRLLVKWEYWTDFIYYIVSFIGLISFFPLSQIPSKDLITTFNNVVFVVVLYNIFCCNKGYLCFVSWYYATLCMFIKWFIGLCLLEKVCSIMVKNWHSGGIFWLNITAFTLANTRLISPKSIGA
jgi:hypothetical protein